MLAYIIFWIIGGIGNYAGIISVKENTTCTSFLLNPPQISTSRHDCHKIIGYKVIVAWVRP